MELKPLNIYGQGDKISQYDLEEIFLIQYNDLFSKLFKMNIEDFFSLLKKQILFHLKIIDKHFDISLLSFFYEKYYDKCRQDKLRIQNLFNKIKNYSEENLISLNILDIYIHCSKCKEARHKCGNKLIIFEDLFFCLTCQKVYNYEHIKLFCKYCNKSYLTSKRSLSDKRHEYFYAVSYMNYHCYIENEEKIKCLNCGDDLYYNITKKINEDEIGIRDIYCIKCKLIFDTKKIYFKCKVCNKNFKCEPQIYRNFSSIKKYILLLVHTFRKGIYAIPNSNTNKKCNCDLNGVIYFLHHDKGILYQGKKNGKKVIICNCCYGIFKPDNFNWICPFCKKNFGTIKTYDMPNKSRRIIRKQKKVYIPTSNTNSKSNIIVYNDLNRQSENLSNYNNEYYNSIAFPNDNTNNNPKHLIQSASFVHNRGFSLNINNKGQKKYFNLINNNSNLDIYNKDKIFIKFERDYSRNNDFVNNYSYDKKLIKSENNQRANIKYKNIKLKKKYLNKNKENNIDSESPNNYNKKKPISNLNRSYNINNNITDINNHRTKSYYIISRISNDVRNYVETPTSNRIVLKGSKSVNNLKKNVKMKLEEPKSTTNRSHIKIMEKKFKNAQNIPSQNYKNNNNKIFQNQNNINISINNNVIQMNYSSIDSNSNNKDSSPNIMRISKDVEQKNNNKEKIQKIIKYNSKKDIYQKKMMKDQNVQAKSKRKESKTNKIKNNPFIDDNKSDLINKKENVSQNINMNVYASNKNLIKGENKKILKSFKSIGNLNKNNSRKIIIKNVIKSNDNNYNNSIIQNINKNDGKEKLKERINEKNDKILKSKIFNKIQKIENEKNQENTIILRNKNNNLNKFINDNHVNKSSNINIKRILENKKNSKNVQNLVKYNIINNKIISNDKKIELNHNNAVYICINNNENKKLLIENKELKKSIPLNNINKKTNHNYEEDIMHDKGRKSAIIKEKNQIEKNSNNKLPLDSKVNKIKKENPTNNMHKKNLSMNPNYLNCIKNDLNIKKTDKNEVKKTNIIINKNTNESNNIKNNNNISIITSIYQKKDNLKKINEEKKQKINNNKENINNNCNFCKRNVNINKNKESNNNKNFNKAPNNILINNKNINKDTKSNSINNKVITINNHNIPQDNNINTNKNNISKDNNSPRDNNISNNKSSNKKSPKNDSKNNNKEKENNAFNNHNNKNLCSSTNFEDQISNKLNVIFNNKINVSSNKKLSKSINFNIYNNINNINKIDFNLKCFNNNISNDIKLNSSKNSNSKNAENNNAIKNSPKNNSLKNSLKNKNEINLNQKGQCNLIIKKFEEVNNNNITYNSKNSNNINNGDKAENKTNYIIQNNLNNFIRNNANNNSIYHSNNFNNYSMNNIFSNKDNLRKGPSINKLGNNNYHIISKSTNNNLICNIQNNNTKINNNINISNIKNNSNNNIINSNNRLNDINNYSNNINKDILEDNPNIIPDIDEQPEDTVRNNNADDNIINKKNDNQPNYNNNLNDKIPIDNIKPNKINKIIANNNKYNNDQEKNGSKIEKENKNKIALNDSYVINIKNYFLKNEKLKEINTKRCSTFDCRNSTNYFEKSNNQEQIEIKTFDSNYFKIIRQIGKGTYGEIYLVQDPKTLALFALKKIVIRDSFELKDNQEEYKLTWKLTHENPELKIAKKLAIEIKKLDKYNLVMYILMEAANCDWEHELLNRQKANAFYTEIELLSILKSLVNTFAILQKKGISHRDVKPQNILCFGNEGYKLTDFGEAKRNKRKGLKNLYGFEQDTNKQTVRGTELYMSPILFRALQTKNIDCAQYNAYKSDVFSLGMCFLLASSLNYQSLFEIREVLDMKIIEKVVNKYLGKKYSKNYINLIISMLQVDEKLRPDFLDLNSAFI